MRVPSQISVTTTEQASEQLGKKRVMLTAGSTAVLVAFSYRLARSRETDFFTIASSKVYKFEAPKGKKIWYVFCKTASGTSTLDIVATDMDIDLIA